MQASPKTQLQGEEEPGEKTEQERPLRWEITQKSGGVIRQGGEKPSCSWHVPLITYLMHLLALGSESLWIPGRLCSQMQPPRSVRPPCPSCPCCSMRTLSNLRCYWLPHSCTFGDVVSSDLTYFHFSGILRGEESKYVQSPSFKQEAHRDPLFLSLFYHVYFCCI